MTRVILTVGRVGSTYADTNFSNVYDFSKHFLSYKYKDLKTRELNSDWFSNYMRDWCNLIDSGKYDVVLGNLYPYVLDYLHKKGYNIELLLVKPDNNSCISFYLPDNSYTLYQFEALKTQYSNFLKEYRNSKKAAVRWFITSPLYLSDFLVLTGTDLYNECGSYSYYDLIENKITNAFNKNIDSVLLGQYLSLVTTALTYRIEKGIQFEITERMVRVSNSLALRTNSKENVVSKVSNRDFSDDIGVLNSIVSWFVNMLTINLVRS